MSIARPILDQINKYESPDTKKIVVTNVHGTAIVYCENPTFQEWRKGDRFPTKPYLIARLDNRIDSREELGIGRSAVERISALTDRDDLNWEIYHTERLPENERIALSKKYNLQPATQTALDAMTYLEVDYLLPPKPQPARREDYEESMRKQTIQERKEKIAIKKEN